MKIKRILKDRRSWWIVLGLMALLIRIVLPADTIENYYSRGFFVFFRKAVDSFTQLIPFPLVYLLFFILLFWLTINIWEFLIKTGKWYEKLGSFTFSLLALFGGIVFFFLSMWGYNYGRVSVEKQLGLSAKKLMISDLKLELDLQTILINQLRNELPNITDSAITKKLIPKRLEEEIREDLKRILFQNGFPISGNVRGRLLSPSGLLLRINTAGVYIPFTAEGHIDAGLHALQIPYVMAHEMSHGYGFGDEGTCNFWAWLACSTSDNPFIKYAGELSHWRSLAGNYKFYQEEDYANFFKNVLPEGIKNDLRAIYQNMDKYPDLFPKLRNAIYDSYLKAQGIEEGIENYERGMMLIRAWKEKTKELKN